MDIVRLKEKLGNIFIHMNRKNPLHKTHLRSCKAYSFPLMHYINEFFRNCLNLRINIFYPFSFLSEEFIPQGCCI